LKQIWNARHAGICKEINPQRMQKLWVLLMTGLVLSGARPVEEKTVTGKVISADDGSALPGINVVLKGTTLGTSTNVDGYYQINTPADDATLVFSFIGLKTQEIEVDSRAVINVSMGLDAAQLSEVAVMAICFQREPAPISKAEKRKRKKARN
jgi:hypothetical protein